MGFPTANGRSAERGFTLLELIIVITIIGILAAIVVPTLWRSPIRAKEAVLKTNLLRMRDCINQYKADKGVFPPSLDALVEEEYLRSVPIDPITQSSETWIVVFEEFDEDEAPPETELGDGSEPGVIDVYSGAEGASLNGDPYADW